MEGIVERRLGSFIKKWKPRYFVLNRDVLQSFAVNQDGGPEIHDLKAEIFLPELVHMEALPNYGLNLIFEDESIWWLRFKDETEYQCWLSYFVVFHADSLPFVPSTYLHGIWTAFEYIQSRAWKVEGIFRVPGLKREKLILTKDLIRSGTVGGKPVILDEVDIPTLSSASKTLIDMLPATLLTEHLYEKFLVVDKEDSSKLANLVYQLPPQNRAILQHILFTLTKIADETELTKMNSKNLGILFGTMFVSRTKSVKDYVLDIQGLQQLISSLIIFYDIIFKDFEPSYPLYVPKLQRDLLEAQNIDITDLKSMLTQRDAKLLQICEPEIIHLGAVKGNSEGSLLGEIKTKEESVDALKSLTFINVESETAVSSLSKLGDSRPSQHQEGINFPSRKLDQLLLTIRENAIPRDVDFAGGCCIMLRCGTQNSQNVSDIDLRRSTRFSTRSSY